jgi:hypothetical protein
MAEPPAERLGKAARGLAVVELKQTCFGGSNGGRESVPMDDAAPNRTSFTDAAGCTSGYSYDSLNRLEKRGRDVRLVIGRRDRSARVQVLQKPPGNRRGRHQEVR